MGGQAGLYTIRTMWCPTNPPPSTDKTHRKAVQTSGTAIRHNDTIFNREGLMRLGARRVRQSRIHHSSASLGRRFQDEGRGGPCPLIRS